MTREEAIHFANCLKNNYTINLNDMQAFCDEVIKALGQESSTEEQYEYVYIGNGAYEKRPKVKSEPITNNILEVQKAIEIIKADSLASYSVNEILSARDLAVEALKQMPTTKNDLALIHTEGLDEEIRCTMCTNYMKSDRGCDGSCVVNKDMYKAVMDAIEKRIQLITKND